MNQEQITTKDDTIKIGKKLKVEFTSITHDGMGICKINGINAKGEEYSGFPLFVLGALPKEEGIIEIEKLHKTYGYAKLIRIFPDKVSKHRTTPICKHYPECGGWRRRYRADQHHRNGYHDDPGFRQRGDAAKSG